ncbi:Uncharacterized protein TCM_003704 [Theobroma cacao]|uniref:Uncharacterized protein n=1 Tax=Theobroma cacao TaxID=3641 RepID=A0A061DN56_THECC|nr:Uncharacterized protein TCM_003704 [Theobroma cacao]
MFMGMGHLTALAVSMGYLDEECQRLCICVLICLNYFLHRFPHCSSVNTTLSCPAISPSAESIRARRRKKKSIPRVRNWRRDLAFFQMNKDKNDKSIFFKSGDLVILFK